MTKPKNHEEEMKEREEREGLEIVAIGSLYVGPWEKKYWSSSRGKDRYPYPVGYHARRAYNGSSYKMEIHEGPKGPLFLVSSANGDSCSGHTPDVAWDKFQKKCCSRVKVSHGKRSLPKMGGVEFFGFKNSLVQRLLRELVAVIDGVPEQSSILSSSCSTIYTVENSNRCSDACNYPDLLKDLIGPQVTGTRSKRCVIIRPKLSSVSVFKRPRPGDLACIAEASNSTSGKQSLGNSLPPSSYCCKEHQNCSGCSEENSKFSAKVVECSDHLTENDVPGPKERKHSVTIVSNLSEKDKILDRSRAAEMDYDFLKLEEDNTEISPFVNGSESTHHGDIWAPDSLDFVQDDVRNYATHTKDQTTCGVKEKLIMEQTVISEGLVTESHPEEEIGASFSSLSSEKSDFDSVGHEIAKSMITVLLPQAIPLLTRNVGKKKKSVSTKNSSIVPMHHEGDNETGYLFEASSCDTDHPVVPSCELSKCVVLDSFDACGTEDIVPNQLLVPSNFDKTGKSMFDKDANTHIAEEYGNILVKDSSCCHVETSNCKDIFCHDEVQLASSSKHGDANLDSYESKLVCKSSKKKIFSTEEHDVSSNPDNYPLCDKIHHEGRLKYACDYSKGTSDVDLTGMGCCLPPSRTDNTAEASTIEPGNTSFIQVPKMVYTRKKVSNRLSTTKKYNASVPKGVRNKNLVDGSFPETTGTLCAPNTTFMNSADNETLQNVCFEAKPGVSGQFQSQCTDGMNHKTITSNPMPENVSRNQTSFHDAGDVDMSKFYVSSDTVVEKMQSHPEERLVEDEKILYANDSTLSCMQESEFSHEITCAGMNSQANSDMKPQRNLKVNNELDGMVESVGCYFHPKPVSMLFLRIKDNKIYICAVCGSVLDKDRMLFLYKLAAAGTSIGQPSFVGHTSVTLPCSPDIYGIEIALERSGMQLTPDGEHLVLLGNIRTPFCREARIDCSCPDCASADRADHHSVNILHVKFGYVSILAKLSTVEIIQCILVCEPSSLVAAGESGKLHIWTMNSEWSVPEEEFVIEANDYMHPAVVELQRIPKCAPLIVGHNGLGEFTIWNIFKRITLSKFSSPNNLAFQFFPISLFNWQKEGHGLNYPNVKEHMNKIMDATKLCFSENSENHHLPSFEAEDTAIWLLVSTINDSDVQHGYVSSHCQMAPVGLWRLALMVRNRLILGSILDSRAAAIGVSGGHGIIGTQDGLLYMWELSTGNKLGNLHHFKGGRVSCIATDDSRPGILAAADDSGQILVYRLRSEC